MIAIFTHHDPVGEKSGGNTFQYQSIAYSNDKGRTWTTYNGNPVLNLFNNYVGQTQIAVTSTGV